MAPLLPYYKSTFPRGLNSCLASDVGSIHHDTPQGVRESVVILPALGLAAICLKTNLLAGENMYDTTYGEILDGVDEMGHVQPKSKDGIWA